MTNGRWRPGPPGGTVPVVVPGDLALVDRPGLMVWAGAITAYPEGFEFTLLMLFDAGRMTAPATLALDAPLRNQGSWIAVRFGDGRYRAADLNANTPSDQPDGPHLTVQHAEGHEGRDSSRWWVSPLPPPGPVELAVHLNGELTPTGTGYLDGAALVSAASSAEILWPMAPQRGSR
jgi:hypothetical protein